jgi:hypothetical protein
MYCIKYIPHQFTQDDARVVFDKACNSFSTTELYKTDVPKGSIISAYIPYIGCYSKFDLKYGVKYTISNLVTIETDKGSTLATVNIKFGIYIPENAARFLKICYIITMIEYMQVVNFLNNIWMKYFQGLEHQICYKI